MSQTEKDPGITALVYDVSGGSHSGNLRLLEDVVEDPNSYAVPADVMDRDDITDMLAIQSIRMSRLKAGLHTPHTKFFI